MKSLQSQSMASFIKFVLVPVLAGPLVLKAIYVDDFLFRFTNTRFFGAQQVLANDAIIFAGLLGLFYLAALPRMPSVVSSLLKILALSIFFLYSIDYLIIRIFNTHLVFIDVLKYQSYAAKYLSQLYNRKGLIVLLGIIGLLVFSVVAIITHFKVNNRREHQFCISVILGFLLASCFVNNDTYVHSWVYRNLFDYNATAFSESTRYSDDFVLQDGLEEGLECIPQPTDTPNIVMLMVESLSSYQSKFFSGIYDWTPNLDAIAATNISFKNFYANGFTTADGEIALLTGRFPIFPPSSYIDDEESSFKGFYNLDDAFPTLLRAQGYTSEFLTTADLAFSNTGNWARSIGFDLVEGHEHPSYNNWERSTFKAAPDEALYNRILQRVEHNLQGKFFIFAKTVSTHHPFKHPETKKPSEVKTFKYADQELGKFYKKLKASGFFGNGILVIVGDHHSMIPLKKEELEKFDPLKAAAKVPLVVSFGGEEQSIELEQYQQVDVFNSIIGIVSGEACASDWMGNYFFDHQKRPPKYILHRRGDNRDIISVFAKDETWQIKLDGDDTRVVGHKNLDTNIERLLVNKVNALRIAATNRSRAQP